MTILIEDDLGHQIPQYQNALGTAFEPVKGANGGVNVNLSAGATTTAILQSAVSATSNGAILDVSGMSTCIFDIQGTFVGTITFEGSTDDSVWYPINTTQMGGNVIATTATVVGLYRSVVTGLKSVRARVTWASGTSVTVKARTTPLEAPSKVVNATVVGSLVNNQTSVVVTANTNILTANYTSTKYSKSVLQVMTNTAGVLSLVVDGVSGTLNSGINLVANAWYEFDISLLSGLTYNLKLSVGATMQVKWQVI